MAIRKQVVQAGSSWLERYSFLCMPTSFLLWPIYQGINFGTSRNPRNHIRVSGRVFSTKKVAITGVAKNTWSRGIESNQILVLAGIRGLFEDIRH